MRNLIMLILSAFMIFVLGIKILSLQVTEFQLWKKPYVKVSISPENPTTEDMITFTVIAYGSSEPDIGRITIKVNDREVKVCLMSPCVYRGGPYPEGLLSYSATVFDIGWYEFSPYGSWIIHRKLYIKDPASLPKKEEGLSRRVIHLIPLAENEETRWANGTVPLPFPGGDDSCGFVDYRYNAVLEDERVYQKVLLMHPPYWRKDGMILGVFKIENLAENAIFKAKVGFLEESVQGDVKEFRVFVNEDPTYYAAIQCFHDGHLDDLFLNLDKYAGQNVELVLQVLVLQVIARGASLHDGSVWVDPRIEW